MISKNTFNNYLLQYKKNNPNVDDFTLVNHFFNWGYWYGRRKEKIDKFDIPKDDMYYKYNPTK